MSKDSYQFNHLKELPAANLSALRNRQSVRVTFRLTPQSIKAVSTVSIHLGIKQKSLFDHLIEDSQVLNTIVPQIDPDDLKSKHRVQKTFVISRKSLFSLENISREFNIPRDVLVEYSIQRLLPLISEEKERHKKRIEAFSDLDEFYKRGTAILQKWRNNLGADDPIYNRLERFMTVCETFYNEVESIIKRNEIIERF